MQCLRKDTLISCLDGTAKKIEDLVGTQPWVYAYDHKSEEIRPAQASAVWKSGVASKLTKVTLDNGESLETTGFHPYLMRDGSYLKADELRAGDSLMPLNIKEDDNGYLKVVHPRIKKRMGHYSKEEKLHLLVSRVCSVDNIYDGVGKIHVHHKDGNRKNNLPGNLVICSSYQHHAVFHGDYHRESMSERNRVRKEIYPEWDQNQRQAVRAEVRRRLSKTGAVLGISDPAERSRIHREKVWGVHRYKIVRALQAGHNKPESIEAHRQASYAREASIEPIAVRNLRAIAYFEGQNLDWRSSPEKFDALMDSVPRSIQPLQSRRKSTSILERGTWDEFVRICDARLKPQNHKIARIEVIELETPIEVYGMEVLVYHNFAVDAGVFIHNCLSSILAGLGIYYMTEYCRGNNLSTRVDCFTHDSGDLDIQIADVPKILNILPSNAIDRIQSEFDVPVKTDFEIGLSGNRMIGLKHMQVDGDLVLSEFEGKEEDVNSLIHHLELYGVKAAVKIETEKMKFKSRKELFMPKRGYSMDIGSTYKIMEGSLELDFSRAIRA